MVRTNQRSRINKEYLEIKIREPVSELNKMYFEKDVKHWSPVRLKKYKNDCMDMIDDEINRRMKIDNKREKIIRDAKEWAEIGIKPELEIKKEEIKIVKGMYRSHQNKMFFDKLDIVKEEIKNHEKDHSKKNGKDMGTKVKQRDYEPSRAR